MFFCQECRYSFNVTDNVIGKQVGGKINKALTKLLNKFDQNDPLEEKDLNKIKGKDILGDERFENMTKVEQKKLISQIKSINKNFFAVDDPSADNVGSNIAYFICKYCGNPEEIEPGTLIYSKNYGGEVSVVSEDYTYAIYDPTLPRTRNYICKNPDCKTHKDNNIKEAVITKNASDQIVYVCTVCSTFWVNIV